MTITTEKKEDILHTETIDDLEKPGAVKRDYSGAVTELSPAESALKRKLDIRIMVCMLCNKSRRLC
jgi:hypothetical protein